MKKTFEIGPGLTCDMDRLVASRLLVQANSGGGKTRTLRRLLEQSHGRLQHLVIDPEGEYHTLREHFDYVLAAPSGGDTVAHQRTAAMLAERLLQLNVSAILDIYELNPDQRVLFVQRFLDALVNAPRDLWHPVLVVLDEAHVYAPEGKENASTSAVKAMASRGRKRGFCLVPATQRLSKLSKDVAAECNNKLIGRCTLDVDIKRAAEELGFTSRGEQQALRQLEPGQFYGYGPAFGVSAPVLVTVGGVKSHHPEPGQKAAPVPAPTDKVKKVLQQLADLPAEAEEREKTVKQLKDEVTDLKRQLKLNRPGQIVPAGTTPATKIEKVPALTDAERALIAKLAASMTDRTEHARQRMRTVEADCMTAIQAAAGDYMNAVRDIAGDADREIEKALDQPRVKKLLEKLNGLAMTSAPVSKPAHIMRTNGQSAVRAPQAPKAQAPKAPSPQPQVVGDASISGPQQQLLNTLAFLKKFLNIEPATRQQLALVARVSSTSSGFEKNVGRLRVLGLVAFPGNRQVQLTEEGAAIATAPEEAPSRQDLHGSLLSTLSGPQADLLRVLIVAYPSEVTRSDLAAKTNVSPTSSGFEKNIGRLKSLGMATYPTKGSARAADVLFPEGLS